MRTLKYVEELTLLKISNEVKCVNKCQFNFTKAFNVHLSFDF